MDGRIITAVEQIIGKQENVDDVIDFIIYEGINDPRFDNWDHIDGLWNDWVGK